MKLTAILLTICCLQVAATGNSQTVTLKLKDASLATVFKELNKQTGFEFFYNASLLDKAEKVTINVKNAPLSTVLQLCFEKQPLDYTIENNAIVVKPKPERDVIANDEGVKQPALTVDIRARILNDHNEPVPGASVTVKGNPAKGTSTNSNGEFQLSGVDESATLLISATNILPLEIKLSTLLTLITTNNPIPTITVRTKETTMGEVIINKGYYTEKQKYSVSNVGRVTAKEIENSPVNNPLLALQGRVPGLVITQSTGLSGSGVTVRIQGQNSLGSGSDPLYIIDGVPYPSQMLPTVSRVLGGSDGNKISNGAGNTLSFLNLNDIESIEVLKDADATSIYGSRAAAGAILITTKKGKSGQTRVTINSQNGWGKVSRKLDVMNTQQYLQMRREALNNDGIDLNAPPYNSSFYQTAFFPALSYWDSTRNTDWQRELIGGVANFFDVQASASGGTSHTQFLIAGGYHKETSVFPGDLFNRKGSLHININNRSVNEKFNLQFSASFLSDQNQIQNQDLTEIALTLAPNAPKLYKEDGNLNWEQIGGVSTWNNPLAYVNGKYRLNTQNLISNLVVGYEIFKGLEIRSSFGYNSLETNDLLITPLSYSKPEDRPTRTRFTDFGDGSIKSWIIEPQINYNKVFGNGKLDVIVGSTFQNQRNISLQQTGEGFNSDAVMEDLKSAPTVTVKSSINSLYNYNAVFGRAGYNLFDKYLINVTARRDGSSRFGSNNLFANFWSIGTGWIFSKEKFIEKNLSFLSFGKIKISYGTTGNQQIGEYRFLNLYNPISAGQPYQNQIGLGAASLSNPNVQWEQTKKLQSGIDLGFFTDRILVSATYFRNISSNQLLAYPLPGITGFQNISSYNLPAVIVNKGWELTLRTVNFERKDFGWSSNLNFTIPKNKLLDYPGLATSTNASNLIIGQPFTITKAYKYLGVDPATGLFLVADINGNPTSKPSATTDRTVIINTAPSFYGGLQNSFRFKDFRIEAFFQFVKQIGQNYYFGNFAGGAANQPLTVLNRWRKPGDNAEIQKYSTALTSSGSNWSTAYSAATSSDISFGDASYCRLKNLSISWQVAQSWLDKIKVNGCRLYLNGQNLLTITKYPGMDPENRSTFSLPALRVITFGIQVTL